MADIYAPIRAGSDIAFLGGLINYVLQNELYFKEYARHPRLKSGGLSLDSTATHDIFADVVLWLHGPRHQGQLTNAPYSSNLVG